MAHQKAQYQSIIDQALKTGTQLPSPTFKYNPNLPQQEGIHGVEVESWLSVCRYVWHCYVAMWLQFQIDRSQAKLDGSNQEEIKGLERKLKHHLGMEYWYAENAFMLPYMVARGRG